MKRSKLTLFVALAVFAIVVMPGALRADTVTFDNSHLSGYAGQTVTFTGGFVGTLPDGWTVEWTGNSPCPGNLCLDLSPFFTLNSGDNGDMFSITIDNSIAFGFYSGQFITSDGDGNTLASANFDVNVTETPEPGSLVLLGSGLVGVAGTLRRRILG